MCHAILAKNKNFTKQKLKKMNKQLILVIFCFVFASTANAQQKQTTEDITPKWIVMMNDENSNYFKTIEEFRKFWEGKALPEEPFEDKEMDVFEKEVGLINDNMSHKERERIEEKAREERKRSKTQTRNYAAEVRAFKGWMMGVKPWVLANGTIVKLEEQQKIIDKQRQELNQIENQNKR